MHRKIKEHTQQHQERLFAKIAVWLSISET